MNYFSNVLAELFWHSPVTSWLAQNITDPNVLGQMQSAWNNFVKTGQVWALLIGLVIGYLIRNLTSYG